MARGKSILTDMEYRIIQMLEKSISYAEIAMRLSIFKSTVQYIIKSCKETNSVKVKPRNGKISLTYALESHVLGKIIRENWRATTADINNEWKEMIRKKNQLLLVDGD